jgi:nitrite reductase/ring-hydroxylating ferredoxin subunit
MSETILARSNPQKHVACGGCAVCQSRRSVLGQMSAALLATIAGVELWAETAQTVPVSEARGAKTSPTERSYPVPATDSVAIDRDEQLIVVRFQERAFAFSLACPHENAALRWKEQVGRFQCPRHAAQFQSDGTFISGRATRNMDRFAIRRSGDNVVVDLNRLFRSDQQTQDWANAVIAL